MSSNKPEKFPRPKIKLDSTAKDWEQFTVTWTQYKQEYNLAGAGLIRQLIACCSEKMKQEFSRLTGRKQFTLTETQLLAHMKNIAVRYQSSNKPEKFPRPKIKLDSKAEDWEEFTVTWRPGPSTSRSTTWLELASSGSSLLAVLRR